MNIFICQTPFQLFYTKILMKNLSSEKEFLIIHSDLNINDKWSINVEFFNIRSKKGILNEFIQLKQAIKIINNKVDSALIRVNFYIPHTGGLIPNYIFHKSKFQKNSNIKINLYYEGVLYFYDFKEKFQSFHFKRILTAFILGFKYKVDKIILPYNSKNIEYIYTPFIKFTKGPKDKLLEVTFENKFKLEKVKSNHFLILGGPVNYLKEFYEMSLKDIIESGIESPKIFYKGHASFNTHNNNYKEIFSQIIKQHNLQYQELDINIAVEHLIHKVEPLRIYSYYSSSLLNIKAMSVNSYDIVCYFDNKQPEELLEKIFRYYNISIVKIN